MPHRDSTAAYAGSLIWLTAMPWINWLLLVCMCSFLDLACGSGEATQAVKAFFDARADELELLPLADDLGEELSVVSCASSTTAAQGPQQRNSPTCEPALPAQEPLQMAPSATSAPGPQQGNSTIYQPSSSACEGKQPHTRRGVGGRRRRGLQLCVDGADPFTGAAYLAWTGKHAQTFSFEVCFSLADERVERHVECENRTVHMQLTKCFWHAKNV